TRPRRRPPSRALASGARGAIIGPSAAPAPARGNTMLRNRHFAALACLLLLPAAVPAQARKPAAQETKVPHWDARGGGLPAWQGVACLDVNDDATRIVLGTTAPAGDPNVLLLDGDGKVLRQQRAGQRWINQVALGADGDPLRAVCTMPAGRAGDMPEV